MSSVSHDQYCDALEQLFPHGEIHVLNTSEVDRGRHKVHFHEHSKGVANGNTFLSNVRTGKVDRVYGILEIHDATPDCVRMIMKMAPPPSSTTPFLLPQRFTVFFTILSSEECFLVVPHVDEHGSGPLIQGPSVIGAFTSVALCAPDYSITKESIPPEIENVFSSNTVSLEPTKSSRIVHVVNMNARGAQVNIPAGCWHAVRTYGSSIRVSYYFQQRHV